MHHTRAGGDNGPGTQPGGPVRARYGDGRREVTGGTVKRGRARQRAREPGHRRRQTRRPLGVVVAIVRICCTAQMMSNDVKTLLKYSAGHFRAGALKFGAAFLVCDRYMYTRSRLVFNIENQIYSRDAIEGVLHIGIWQMATMLVALAL